MDNVYYNRWLEKKLKGNLSKNKIRLIFGARQTGKTMLLNKLMPKDKTKNYNLQDSRLRRRYEKDPSLFSRELQVLDKKIKNIFVDEIQKVPELLDEIQYIYDLNKTRFQFFLTGSSARKLRKSTANLLPGRSHIYNLFPVSLFEEENCEKSVIKKEKCLSNPFPEKSLEWKLLYGNLPGVRNETAGSAIETLDAYVTNYLEEEIRKEALVKKISSFEIFLQLAAIENSKQVNLLKMSKESGIPVSTLKNYYQTLVDTFVGYWMPAFKASPRKRVLTTPRFYFFDIGVRNAAAELNLNKTILSELGGFLFESLVGLELLQKAVCYGRGYNVSFWRTVSGAEVDFIFETPKEIIPIEVKWSENPKVSHAKNIEKFIDIYPEKAKKGFVVCRTDEPVKISKRVTAIPYNFL